MKGKSTGRTDEYSSGIRGYDKITDVYFSISRIHVFFKVYRSKIAGLSSDSRITNVIRL